MSPSLIARIIGFVDAHSPVVPAIYDPAADAVMVPEEIIVSEPRSYRIEMHPCRTMVECRAALGYNAWQRS